MVTVNWVGDMVFESDPPSGKKIVMDAYTEFGGTSKGPTPVETFLSAIAACSAMDVLAILQKKQQKVTGYRIEVEGERPPQGQFPRPFTSLVVRHIVTGQDIDPHAVERAVELSDQKYCSVMATIRSAPPITSEFRIEEAAPATLA
jgi:putative redox protein